MGNSGSRLLGIAEFCKTCFADGYFIASIKHLISYVSDVNGENESQCEQAVGCLKIKGCFSFLL